MDVTILQMITLILLPEGGAEYCIAKCTPKENNAGGTVKLVIPALIGEEKVSLLSRAFKWNVYNTDSYSRLDVELVFQSAQNPETGDIEYVTFPASLAEMFRECGNDGAIDETNKISKTKIDLSGANLSTATDFHSMFYNCFRLTSVDFGNLDTSNVTDMGMMFRGCENLMSLDLSRFNTSKVTNMWGMFSRCLSLTTLNLGNFDTSKVDTQEVTDGVEKKGMQGMFNKCENLISLDISNFDTGNVTDTSLMFYNCTNLAELRVSTAFVVPDTPEKIENMFVGAKSGTKIICVFKFSETDDDIKNAINGNADKVYAVIGDLGVSESLQEAVTNQLTNANFPKEANPEGMFSATASDAVYVGMSASNQTITVDGTNKTIAGALINKTISGIGYYPATLQLTGTITLSGNNSEFNHNSFIIGDGTKNTTITLANPSSLPQTDITVEAKGTLVLGGTEHYTLSKNLTVKSGGYLQSSRRITVLNGSMFKFGE